MNTGETMGTGDEHFDILSQSSQIVPLSQMDPRFRMSAYTMVLQGTQFNLFKPTYAHWLGN
jgi:hypothetical protein